MASNVGAGHVKGEPLRYINQHHRRSSPVDYIVDPETGCWVWQLYRNPQTGYAVATRDGQRGTIMHRWYYEQAKGPIPDGLVIDHLCRNHACVNPDHLEPVTQRENCLRGAQAKLSNGQVRAVRAAVGSYRSIASHFGITHEYVGRIRRGEARADA